MEEPSMLIFKILLLLASMAIGGTDGKVAAYWERGFVLYAEVMEVRPVTHSSYKIRLKPLATLTGNFDAAFENELDVEAVIGSLNTGIIMRPPEKGSRILVLVQDVMSPGMRQVEKTPPTYFIYNGDISFF